MYLTVDLLQEHKWGQDMFKGEQMLVQWEWMKKSLDIKEALWDSETCWSGLCHIMTPVIYCDDSLLVSSCCWWKLTFFSTPLKLRLHAASYDQNDTEWSFFQIVINTILWNTDFL